MSSAVVKLLRAGFRTSPVLRVVGWGTGPSIVCRDTREGSGPRTTEGVYDGGAGTSFFVTPSACGIPASKQLAVLDRDKA